MWEEYIYECRERVEVRKRNLDAVVAREEAVESERVIVARRERLQSNTSLLRQFPAVPEAQAWLQLFQHDALRYPLLVVLSGSFTGKTWWVKSLFQKPLLLRVGHLVDYFPAAMREFSRSKCDGIILDDVRDLEFLSKHQDKL